MRPAPSPAPGLLADTIRFSWVDGPGNRFVAFLQGCDFDCLACHNPHTIPHTSVRARQVTVDDLVEEIRPVAPFLSGVTVSGGEATRQAAFLHDLFAALARELPELTRFVDSNGDCDAAVWRSLLPVMDAAMLDLKALDPEVHRFLTGRDNDRVLASLELLAGLGRLYEVRLLIVPGVNDSADQLARTAAWLAALDLGLRVRVIGFRHHGVRAPGRTFPEACPEDLRRVETALRSAGLAEIVLT